MRTRRFFKYLMAMIIALGTAINAMAQQRNLKIYFNQYSEGATGAPTMLVKDDNDSYGLPAGLTYWSEGMAWAKEARFFEWVNQDVNDRLIADYVTNSGTVDKKNSHLKISFENFPYEVNGIQWNVMNDLLSGSITDFFKNYNVTTKCTPVSGSGFSYTEEHWSMNIFQHSTTFNQGSIPWQDGAILKGLKSFELSEKYFVELGIGNWTFWNLGQSELSAKCRTFFKAGWNGSETNSNITDGDDSNWAFKVTFTMPEIRVRNNRDLYKGDENQIEGYISAHPGAVEVTTNPADPDRFHFKYFSSNENIATIGNTSGIIRANEAGKTYITVKLMRGNREVSFYSYELNVLDLTPSTPDIPTPEICIVFANGKKGYDVSVGDNNVQIHGQIIKRGDGINVTNNQNGYHYEYTSANTDIATIEQDGTITPKKEGDVDISAVLKYGNTVVSNTYTYTLHVFPNDEGLTWQRDNQYFYYNNSSSQSSWEMNNSSYVWNSSSKTPTAYDWKPTDSLKANTVIAANTWNYAQDIDRGHWKQIAWFKTNKYQSWRAICQKIEIVSKVPKYSKLTADYRFAANLTLSGSSTEGACKFSFELKDLGVVTSSDADTKIKSITWKTNSGNSTYSDPEELKTLVRGIRTTTNTYIEVWGNRSTAPKWVIDNKDNDASMSETRYLVAMAHLDRTRNYPAVASFGYKDIPTYTYYSHIYYYKNINDDETYYKDEELYSEGKTETMQLNSNFSAPTRTGYTFLGWSEDPDATSAEYIYKDQFCSYDAVNGGGKGRVDLYAVWRPNTYTVELRHTSTGPVDGYVYANYGQAMPLVDVEGNPVVAPTNKGYDFGGYYGEAVGQGEKYYNADMSSNHVWDRAGADKNYVIARWIPHTTTIVFDPQGGNNNGAARVTATFSSAMPTEGIQAPQRQGYTFGGYYSKANGQGTKYYNADMTSANNWDIDERLLNPPTTEVTLYAKWIKVVFTVTLDADGGTLDFNEIGTWGTILERNPGSLVLQVKKGESECTDIWCSNRINIKPGYKLLGWYTEPQTEEDAHHHPALHPGTLVYSVDPGNNFSYHFRAVSEEANPKYWNSEKKWVGTDDLTLYAHYEMIFEVENDVITFLDSEPKNCVSGEDLTAALDYAKNHGAKLINTLDMTHPDTGADNKQGEDIMKAFEDAKAEAGSIVSPNALIYFTNTWPQNRKTNAITMRQNGGLCQDLVITDRYSIRIPVEFNAQKATYARDAGIVDDETDQAKNSSWGTLCLPYAIKNKNSHVKLYWLESTANNYMEFEEFDDEAIIPANTPVLYCRTDGKVSSKVTIEEVNRNVPQNMTYHAETIAYANPKEGTYPLENVSGTLQNWEFTGNLRPSAFYGKDYNKTLLTGYIGEQQDRDYIYYFKQNKFTRLGDKSSMILYPYRAYFRQVDAISKGAKIAEYSILVIDEDGSTTDITNAIFGDGEGDGKIYDLNGISLMLSSAMVRVMVRSMT